MLRGFPLSYMSLAHAPRGSNIPHHERTHGTAEPFFLFLIAKKLFCGLRQVVILDGGVFRGTRKNNRHFLKKLIFVPYLTRVNLFF